MTTRVWFWRLLSRMPSILFDSYKDILKLSVFRTWTFDLTEPCSQNSSRRYLTTQEPLEKNQFQVLLTWSALHMTRGHQWSVRRLIKNFRNFWEFSKIEMGRNLREVEETLELYKTSNLKCFKVKLKFALWYSIYSVGTVSISIPWEMVYSMSILY